MSQIYKPLHHKYRPESFTELIGQEAIAATLKQALLTNRIAPAYLFCGPRGTGKTSSARILASSLNCIKNNAPTSEPCGKCNLCKSIKEGTSLDIIEIDAASNTGVENIRELIERSKFAPVQARWKVYVIDECHMLSTAAFNALLKTLEEPPMRVVFILATTDPQRVLPTIVSRCQRFDFRRIALKDLIKHLQVIAEKEKIEIELEAIKLIAQRSQGGLRDAESMLDQLSLLPPPITTDSVWNLLGVVPEEKLINLVDNLIKKEIVEIIQNIREILDSGKDPMAILQGLTSILRDLVLITAAPERTDLLSISKTCGAKLHTLKAEVKLTSLLNWQAKLKGAELQLRQSMQPRLWLEVLILGILSEEEIVTKSMQTKNTPTIQNGNVLKPKSNDNELKENNQKEIIKQSSNIKNDTESLWEEILSRLELPSTRMLLSQQAKLTKIDTKKAVIQVSNNWISMVQSRSTLLEEAINQVIGDKRDLIIEASNEDNIFTKSKDIALDQANSNAIREAKAEETKSIEKKSYEIIDNENNSRNNELNLKETKSIKNPNINNGDIDNKAKLLADFFNGEVLDNDESKA